MVNRFVRIFTAKIVERFAAMSEEILYIVSDYVHWHDSIDSVGIKQNKSCSKIVCFYPFMYKFNVNREKCQKKEL